MSFIPRSKIIIPRGVNNIFNPYTRRNVNRASIQRFNARLDAYNLRRALRDTPKVINKVYFQKRPKPVEFSNIDINPVTPKLNRRLAYEAAQEFANIVADDPKEELDKAIIKDYIPNKLDMLRYINKYKIKRPSRTASQTFALPWAQFADIDNVDKYKIIRMYEGIDNITPTDLLKFLNVEISKFPIKYYIYTMAQGGIITNIAKSMNHLFNLMRQIAEDASLITSGSSNVSELVPYRDALAIIDFRIEPVAGGCGVSKSSTKKIGNLLVSFKKLESRKSDNNCGLECINYLLNIKITRHNIREYRLVNNEKINPNIITEIYNKYNTTSKQLRIIYNSDLLQSFDFDKYDYIYFDSDHYSLIDKVDVIPSRQIKRKLMTYDLETRVNPITKKLIPIILHATIEGDRSLYWEGPDCAREFVKWLYVEAYANRHYYIFGHNAGKFDIYFIIGAMSTNEASHLTDIIRRGKAILSVEYLGHCFRDSFALLSSSLASLCDAFNVGAQSKLTTIKYNNKVYKSSEFCFYKPHLNPSQFYELKDKEPKFWNLYNEYCKMDTVSLLKILQVTYTTLRTICVALHNGGKTVVSARNKITTAGLAKSLFLNTHSKFSNILSSLKKVIDTPEKDIFLRKFIRGGMSICEKPGLHDGLTSGVDITSQYPHAMISCKIPTGSSVWVDKEVKHMFGWYELSDVKMLPGLKPIAEIEGVGLNWKGENFDTCYIDTFMLQYLKENNVITSYNVVKGLVCSRYEQGKKLCGPFINYLYSEKNQQDIYKANKDPLYNSALRELIKLLMNSFSGKCVEDPKRYCDLKKACASDIGKFGIQGCEFVSVENDEENINYLLPLGLMIYTFSKTHLFEYIKCLPNTVNDVIAIETDSIYFRQALLNDFVNNVSKQKHLCYSSKEPHNYNNPLGAICLEKNSLNALFLGKKTYYLDEYNIKAKGIPKMTMIDGKQMMLLNREIFENVYKGIPQTVHFTRLQQCLDNNTGIKELTTFRTINKMFDYKHYNAEGLPQL